MLKKVDAVKKRNYIVSLVISIVLMAIFANSFYWESDKFNIRRVFEAVIIITFISIVPFILVKFFNSLITRICTSFINLTQYIKYNIVKVMLYLVGLVLAVLVARILENAIVIFIYGGSYMNDHIRIVMYAIIFIIINLFVFRKKISRRPDLIFILVALVTGVTLILVSPAFTGVSWDDEIHYNRTLSIANVFNGVYYTSDSRVINEYQDKALFHNCYDRTAYTEYMTELNDSYSNHELAEYSRIGYGYYSIAYIPSAIGIMLGRGLGFSFEHVFMLGKLFNLMCYVFVLAYGIKKIRYGKVLLACYGLIPTSIFMASMYSYDFWVIAFISLGYAYLFNAMQTEVFVPDDVIKATIFIIIGAIPKAIYFVLILPAIVVLIIRSDNKKIKRIVGIAIIFAAGLMVLSFMIPIILSSGSYSDMRGGGEVNTTAQILFVLSNPLHYAKQMLGFMKSYIAVQSTSYFQLFAYAGTGSYWVIVTVVLGIVAFLDHGKLKQNENVFRITIWVTAFVAVVLIITALYISFNPVGSTVINGCQPRYLLPILFPVLYSIGSSKVENSISKVWFSILPQLIITISSLYSIYCLFVLTY